MTRSAGLQGLGRALRLLRLRRGRKQFELAAAAEITKAMLSAYETGKRQPSLKTLASILEALDTDLADLHRALLAGRREDFLLGTSAAAAPSAGVGRPRSPAAHDRPYPSGDEAAGDEVADGVDVRRILGIAGPLAAAEEVALAEMLHGFHRLLRYFHRKWRRQREHELSLPRARGSP